MSRRLGAAAGAIALLIAGATACHSPIGEPLEPPEVTLVNVTPVAATAFEQRVKVVLRLTNPNNRDLAIEGLRFSLELNEQPFTRGVSDEGVTLPRLGEETLEVVATTTLIDLMRQVKVMANRQDLDFPYYIEGRIFLGGSLRSLDFQKQGNLGR
ncbi:MAG: LEA type 2 family protein [Myxococcota bacterium]